MSRPVILGFSGSLRKESANTAILTTLAEAVAGRADLRIYPLDEIPLYNGDLDGETRPDAVNRIKEAVAQADGLIMASPEYNYGLSGVLKNTIDWLSQSVADGVGVPSRRARRAGLPPTGHPNLRAHREARLAGGCERLRAAPGSRVQFTLRQ